MTHNPESYSEFRRDAIAHSDVLKAVTTPKRRITDARHTVRYRDAHKAAAIIEGRIADARHAVWNRDAHKTVAHGERPPADARHAISYRDVLKSSASREHKITDFSHAIRNCDALKSVATAECKIADARHAIRNCDARKVRAIEERITSDACDFLPVMDRGNYDVGVGAGSDSGNEAGFGTGGYERQTFRAFVQGSSGGEDNGGFHRNSLLQRDVIARSNVLKARAIQERKTTDRYDAVRNRDTRKTLATPKRISADRRDDLSVIDRRDFDIDVGAGSDSGNSAGSVSVGHELQTFRAFVQGCSGGEDSGGFHKNSFSALT